MLRLPRLLLSLSPLLLQSAAQWALVKELGNKIKQVLEGARHPEGDWVQQELDAWDREHDAAGPTEPGLLGVFDLAAAAAELPMVPRYRQLRNVLPRLPADGCFTVVPVPHGKGHQLTLFAAGMPAKSITGGRLLGVRAFRDTSLLGERGAKKTLVTVGHNAALWGLMATHLPVMLRRSWQQVQAALEPIVNLVRSLYQQLWA